MANMRKREQLAREIEKTSEAIRKKHRALKTGRIEEDIAMERRFKPIVEPLKQIVEESQPIKREAKDIKAEEVSKNIKQRQRDSDDDDDDDDGNDSYKWLTGTSEKRKRSRQSNVTLNSPMLHSTTIESPIKPSTETPKVTARKKLNFDDESSLETSVREAVQTREGREALFGQLGPLGRKYIGQLLGDGDVTAIDDVYGVYFAEDGTKLGDKKFDIDRDDSIIIDKVRYTGTPGLYELIFKKIPDEIVYTEDDKQQYKNILLATNAYRRDYNASNPIRGNRGYKYRNVIGPLVSTYKHGKGAGMIPFAMRLTDNKIDYVHWDDPNELVDRLRLLDASHRAGNDAHGNEMLSIVEELREAGLIIN
jgi:hypothetical protein